MVGPARILPALHIHASTLITERQRARTHPMPAVSADADAALARADLDLDLDGSLLARGSDPAGRDRDPFMRGRRVDIATPCIGVRAERLQLRRQAEVTNSSDRDRDDDRTRPGRNHGGRADPPA